MSKEIIEKKRSWFDVINAHFEEQRRQIAEMEKKIFSVRSQIPSMIVKMDTIDDFKKSIEDFQQKNPSAKIRASAYAYSTGNEPQAFTYESKEEVPKLKTPVKVKKKPKKK